MPRGAPDRRAIAAPTLILTNGGWDLLETSGRAHALRPDRALAALDGGTHDVVDEMPGAWAAAAAGVDRSRALPWRHRSPLSFRKKLTYILLQEG